MACDEPYLGECCDSICASPSDIGLPVVTAFRLVVGPPWFVPPPGQRDLRGPIAWAAPDGGQVMTDPNRGGAFPDPNETPGRAFLKPGRWQMTFTPTDFNDPGCAGDTLIAWAHQSWLLPVIPRPDTTNGAEVDSLVLVHRGDPFRGIGGNLTRPIPGPEVTRQIVIPCTRDGFYFFLAYGRSFADPPIPGTMTVVAEWLSDPP